MGGAHGKYSGQDTYIEGLVGSPEGMRPLGRPKRIWRNNIKSDLQEVWGRGAWNGLMWLGIGTGGEHLRMW
jgi:hypothetical protein